MNTERLLSCLILSMVAYLYFFDPHVTCVPPPTWGQKLVANVLGATILGASTMSLFGWLVETLEKRAKRQ
jgi:hypothetical protein